MNDTDAVAGLLLGGFILIVVYHGNVKDLLALLQRDKSFLPWLVSLTILVWLKSIPQLRGPVSLLILVALVGMALTAGTNISQSASNFWEMLGGGSKKNG